MSPVARSIPGWEVPQGHRPAGMGRCRSCHVVIQWAITSTQTRIPLDRDGRAHFATCPDAAVWRKRR